MGDSGVGMQTSVSSRVGRRIGWLQEIREGGRLCEAKGDIKRRWESQDWGGGKIGFIVHYGRTHD